MRRQQQERNASGRTSGLRLLVMISKCQGKMWDERGQPTCEIVFLRRRYGIAGGVAVSSQIGRTFQGMPFYAELADGRGVHCQTVWGQEGGGDESSTAVSMLEGFSKAGFDDGCGKDQNLILLLDQRSPSLLWTWLPWIWSQLISS